MKKFQIFSFFVLFALYSVAALAADKDKEPPPWMEDIKIRGRSTYLVPKGAKREVIGSQIVVEPPNEYVARRIYEMEQYLAERFKEIEEKQESLKKELEELKKVVEDLRQELKEEEVLE